MIKYGFEREYWCLDGAGKHILCPEDFPMDECGYLAEARGEPYSCPFQAAHSMLAEETKLAWRARRKGMKLDCSADTIKLDKYVFREALRKYGKPGYSDKRHNMYGKDYSVNNSWNRAALHIHFSNTSEFSYKDKDSIVHKRIEHHPIDMCKYILTLDKYFAQDIKKAKRLPGFYEMKPHGFEYRSLPTSTDPIEVAEVLAEVK